MGRNPRVNSPVWISDFYVIFCLVDIPAPCSAGIPKQDTAILDVSIPYFYDGPCSPPPSTVALYPLAMSLSLILWNISNCS